MGQIKDSYGNVEPVFDGYLDKFGTAPDVDQADATLGQVIWPVKAGTQVFKFLDTPTQLYIVSTSVEDVAAAATLTAAGQPGDTETVTIGTKVYTFQTVLTNVDGNVLIGASASATLDNLIAAITLAAGAGTTYAAAMTANEILGDDAAVAGAGDTMTLYVDSGELIATTSTAANLTWGAAVAVAGTGAHSVTVTRSDNLGEEIDEVYYPHGVTPVAFTGLSYGSCRMKVSTSGTTHSNVGDIKVIDVGTDIYAIVTATEGQTQIAACRCPSNKQGKIKAHMVTYGRSVPNTASAQMRLKIRGVDGSLRTIWDPTISTGYPKDEKEYKTGGVTVNPGEWVFWTCIATSADNVTLRASFDVGFYNLNP